jgi:phosphoenolpyruvate carboxykinase (GTP)
MAMIPFCGYNMADYFGHWLATGRRVANPPKIFRVNWFRRDADGKFLWPGYGENVRVLKWIVERIRGSAKAVETPIGFVPTADALDLSGLSIPRTQVEEALAVDREAWVASLGDQGAFFEQFGARLPQEIRVEHERRTQMLRG